MTSLPQLHMARFHTRRLLHASARVLYAVAVATVTWALVSMTSPLKSLTLVNTPDMSETNREKENTFSAEVTATLTRNLGQAEDGRYTLPAASHFKVIGTKRSSPDVDLCAAYLTIGVPTVWRRAAGLAYLDKTLFSLLDSLSTANRSHVTIVVFLADFSLTYRRAVTRHVTAKYSSFLDSGLMLLLEVDASVYPPLRYLKRNFNDVSERVTWRAKQVADFVYLLHYSAPHSKYYLHIEDDVITAPDMLISVKRCIDTHDSAAASDSTQTWTVLEFSELGFIGKLVRTTDATRLAKFLLLFYDEQPVDFLYTYFYRLLAQKDRLLCYPALFQHIGDHSSLGLKRFSVVRDVNFLGGKDISVPLPHSISEATLKRPATVYSTMETHEGHEPAWAYSGSDHYFWGKPVRANDTFCVVFDEAFFVDVIDIETGHPDRHGDYLQHGELTLGAEVDATCPSKCCCGPTVTKVGRLTEGNFYLENVSSLVTFKTKCLQLLVTQSQDEWLIVRHIDILSVNQTASLLANLTTLRMR